MNVTIIRRGLIDCMVAIPFSHAGRYVSVDERSRDCPADRGSDPAKSGTVSEEMKKFPVPGFKVPMSPLHGFGKTKRTGHHQIGINPRPEAIGKHGVH